MTMNLKNYLAGKKASDSEKMVRRRCRRPIRKAHVGSFEKAEGPVHQPCRLYPLPKGSRRCSMRCSRGMLPDTVSRFSTALSGSGRSRILRRPRLLRFIFQLKKIVRQELGASCCSNRESLEELAAFDSAVDDLALFAFDLYMKCREKIYELKANEARSMTFRLLQQAQSHRRRPGLASSFETGRRC